MSPIPARPGVLQRLSEQPYLLLVLTTLAWGGNSVASRAAVGEVSAMALTCVRWGLVMAALFAFGWRRIVEGWPSVRAQWKPILLMGATGYTGFNAIYFTAAHYTTAVNLSIIQGAMPVFIMLGAFAVFRSPIRMGQVLGMGVTIAGIAVVASKGDVATLARLHFNIGDLMMLACCAIYAGFTLALRKLKNASGVAFFAGLAIAAFVSSVPLLGWEIGSGAVQWPTPKGWLLLTYIALVPTALAQLGFMRAVAMIGPGRAGLFINLVPIFGALLAVLILREPFGLYHAAALALVLFGIFLAERSARRGA
jgi:drug/metabolite transporter (DMT)-like permease